MILERPKYISVDGKWIVDKVTVLEYDQYDYTPYNVGMLSEKIRDNLTLDLVSPKYRRDNLSNELFGHCYHATQALYYFLKCDTLVPMSGVDDHEITHWWLQDGETIIDVTAAQYDKIDCDPPYNVGKPTQWYGWKNRPHKRAMRLMKRVQKYSRLYDVDPKGNTLENFLTYD